MTKKQALQIFEEKKIRTVWDDEQEKWFFSIVDVVAVLTDSTNPSDYIKKMKKRDPMLAEGWGQIVTPLYIHTEGGRQKSNCATSKMNRMNQNDSQPVTICNALVAQTTPEQNALARKNARKYKTIAYL